MTLAFVAAITVIMAAVWAAAAWYAHASAIGHVDALLRPAAESARDELGDVHNPTQMRAFLDEERDELHLQNMDLQVLDAHGQVVGQTRPGTLLGHLIWPSRSGVDWRVRTEHTGGMSLRLVTPWRPTAEALARQAWMLALIALASTVAAGLGGWILVGRTLSPIGSLASQARSASAQNLSLTLAPPSRDAEIVELVATLNSLLERLSATFSARARFYAAASHELRTPLTALCGHLELALQRPRSCGEYRDVVEEAHGQAQRLASLVRGVLLLNQVEASAGGAGEQISIAHACSRVIEECEPLRATRGVGLSVDLDPGCRVEANEAHVEILVRNLLENALRYTDDRGRTRMQLRSSAQCCELEIYNECTPPCAQEITRLFEPFYRPDASRSLHTGGLGLGLAICKAIADAHGWRLALESQPHGLLARVEFAD